MSQRAYARRRGVTHTAVQKAIRERRLRDSIQDGRIIDPDLADREWAENTDYTDAPKAVIEHAESVAPRAAEPAPLQPVTGAAPAALTLSEASIAEKHWKAKTAELKFRQEAGELVPAESVAAKLEDTFRTCRTKLLGIPSRARQALPHLTLQDLAALESLVREALEELAS
jgi:hypothetical protein